MTHRLKSWIETNVPAVSAANPVHIHADELLGRDSATQQEWLTALKSAYLETIDILGERLAAVMPILMIPLISTRDLIVDPPDVRGLDVGDEIPSIYLIDRNASKYLARCELYRVFLHDLQLFEPRREDVFCFYEVLRLEQQRQWGWDYTRTIKAEHYLPEHRIE